MWRDRGLRELQDGGLLGFAFLLVAAIWCVAYGWLPWRSLAGDDAWKTMAPFLPDLIAARGDWTTQLYRPGLLGGVQLVDVVGMLPITRWLAWLGASVATCLNGTHLFVQGLAAFWGVRTVLDLRALLRGAPIGRRLIGHAPRELLDLACATALVGFAPVLMWRVCYGHASMIAGLVAFSATISLCVASLRGTVTGTLTVAGFVSYQHALQGHGHQATVYAAIFGLPILASVVAAGLRVTGLGARASAGMLGRVLLVALSAGLASAPLFGLMARTALGADSSRPIGGPPLTYSYIIASARDWLGSLPWSGAVLASDRPAYYLHETNYPLGPLLLVPALLLRGRRERRWLGWVAPGMLASLVLALLFSMKLEPVSGWLLEVLSPLQWFRVPARAALPVAMTLPVVAALALLAPQPAALGRRSAGWILGLCALLAALPPGGREAVLWIGVVGAGLALTLGKSERWGLSPAVLALVLAVGSIAASGERRLGYWIPANRLRSSAAIGADLHARLPELEMPLNRALLIDPKLPLGNRPYGFGVSVPGGYLVPPRRMLRLLDGAAGVDRGFREHLEFRPEDVEYPLVRRLYNVGARVTLGNDGLQVVRESDTGGAAWFSRRIATEPRIEDIGRLLAAPGFGVRQLADSQVVAASEPRLPPGLLADADVARAACGSARVLEVRAAAHGQEVRVGTELDADCPLTLAMNYASSLRVRATGADGVWRELAAYPAYGSLLGMVVPRDAREVHVRAEHGLPPSIWALPPLGLALLGLAAAWALVPVRPPTPPHRAPGSRSGAAYSEGSATE